MGARPVGAIIWQNKEHSGAHGPKVEAALTFRLATASRDLHILPISYVSPQPVGSTLHTDVLQLYYTTGAGSHGSVAEKNMS